MTIEEMKRDLDLDDTDADIEALRRIVGGLRYFVNVPGEDRTFHKADLFRYETHLHTAIELRRKIIDAMEQGVKP